MFSPWLLPGNILGSSEDVGLSRDPVDVLVVKASREAAGGVATDLEEQKKKTIPKPQNQPGLWGSWFLQSCRRRSRSQCEFSPSEIGNFLRIFRFRINQNVKISDKKYTRTLSARPVEERIRNMLSRNRLFIFVSRQALKCAPSDHCMDSGTFRVLHSKLNW